MFDISKKIDHSSHLSKLTDGMGYSSIVIRDSPRLWRSTLINAATGVKSWYPTYR